MEICRLCYKKVRKGLNIFATSRRKPGGYAVDIFNAVQIQLENKPHWPSGRLACTECVEMIRGIRNFRTQLEATQLMLSQMYDKPVEEERIKDPNALIESTEPVVAPISEIKPDLEETPELPEEIIEYKGDITDYSQLETEPSIKEEWIEEKPLESEVVVPQGKTPNKEDPQPEEDATVEPASSPTSDDNNYDDESDSEADDVYVPDLPPKMIEKSSRDLRNRPRVTRSAAKSKQDDDDDDSDFEIPLPKKKKKPTQVPKSLSEEEAKKFKFIAKLNIKYPNREELETIMHSLDILKCYICQDKLESFPALVWHVEKVHNMPHNSTSVMCCNTRQEYYNVYSHMTYHLDETAFQCKTCKKNHHNSLLLSKHMRTAHIPKNERKFQCKKCGKGFHSPGEYKKHKEVHNLGFECSKCNKPFRTRLQMLDHLDFKHDNKSRHICDICGMGFSKYGSFIGHRKRHFMKKRKWEQCDECNLHFANVNQHKKLNHAPAEKQACEICGKDLHVKYLKKHISMVHNKEKKYKCQICGKAFYEYTRFKAHMDIHQGIRYDCHFCSMTYGATSNRQKHMMRKHGPQYEEYKLARNRERAEKRNEAITNVNNALDEN